MPTTITIDISEIASAGEIARRLVERNRWLNGSAIEGLEQIEKTINALGGFDFFNRAEQIERVQKHWELINRVFPGFSELGTLIDPEEADDQSDIKTARASFVHCIDVDGLDFAAKRRLRKMAKDQGKHWVSLLWSHYFLAATVLVIAEIQRPQYIKLGKWKKGRGGKKKLIKPINLRWDELLQWVKRECCKAASAMILEREYPVNAKDPLKKADELDQESPLPALNQNLAPDGLPDSLLSALDNNPTLTELLRSKRYTAVMEKLLPELSRQEKSFFNALVFGSPQKKTLSRQANRQQLSRLAKKSRLILDS